ncbi:MAG: G:T/U mismatch-specific DNA glycosylase [Nitrospira sp.]
MDRGVPLPRTRLILPDYIRPGLRILFVGINPGLRSAATGHHFAGYSNRFWKLLFDSRLVGEPLGPAQDFRLLEWGLGLTNIVARATAGIDSLTTRDYERGTARLLRLISRNRPSVVAILGITPYRHIFLLPSGQPVDLGKQTTTLADASVFVLPNPSGRNAHYPYRTMLKTFRALHRAAGS